jgi:hypothetical protein
VGDLGDKTYTNESESLRAFIGEEFIRETQGMWDDVDRDRKNEQQRSLAG